MNKKATTTGNSIEFQDHAASPAEASASPEPTAFAKGWGQWAEKNRAFFTSEPGEIGFRNFARTLGGVVLYVASNTSLQHFFEKALGNGNAEKNPFGKPLTRLFQNKFAQNVANVAVSFSLFRTFCKVWQRNYDRIFKQARDAQGSAQAIDSLPANVLSDITDISTAELAATSVAAFPLIAIQQSLKIPEPQGIQGNWSLMKSGFVNDWVSKIPSYTVFFETTDRLFDAFGGNHNVKNGNGNGYGKRTNGHYSAFTDDTWTKLMLRTGGSIALGMAFYTGGQRLSWHSLGHVNPAKNSWLKNNLVGNACFMPFALYTASAEMYQRRYDQLFKDLEERYRESSRNA